LWRRHHDRAFDFKGEWWNHAFMKYKRMPIEIEAPEQLGYEQIECNLTESSYTDFKFKDLGLELNELVIAYVDHLGHKGLRTLLAADANEGARQAASCGTSFGTKSDSVGTLDTVSKVRSNAGSKVELDSDTRSGLHAASNDSVDLTANRASRGGEIRAENVLITAGAAQALFIISTTLLEKDSELVVVRPNYATNLETPRAIEAQVRTVELSFENGWKIDPQAIARAITPKTKLVSITVPHNPTGTMMSAAEVSEVVEITRRAGVYLLVDETYREMSFSGVLPYAATLGDHVISVASFSKTFGLPGIRIGWLMTQNASLFEKFFAAKEQIQICGSALDEEIAFQFYQKRGEYLPQILVNIRRRFEILREWMQGQSFLEWVEPSGGCVAFPRFTSETMKSLDLEKFYLVLNRDLKTHVGPGHWFEQEKRYMRIGYGWPSDEELKKGLSRIAAAAKIATSHSR
jgi:aspartate/methionine/tyrosine aminotransferase